MFEYEQRSRDRNVPFQTAVKNNQPAGTGPLLVRRQRIRFSASAIERSSRRQKKLSIRAPYASVRSGPDPAAGPRALQHRRVPGIMEKKTGEGTALVKQPFRLTLNIRGHKDSFSSVMCIMCQIVSTGMFLNAYTSLNRRFLIYQDIFSDPGGNGLFGIKILA